MNGWRKSSHSEGNGGACIEVRDTTTSLEVRDTTNRDGGTLTFTSGAWTAFLGTIR
jgi:hypothetical protein